MSNMIAGSELANVQKELEEQRKGNYSISYEISDLNFDHLRRKRAFISGVNIQLEEEKNKEELVGFQDLPDILPLVPKGNMAEMDYDQLMKTTASEAEIAEATEKGTPGSSLFNYNSEDTASRNSLLDRFELIRKRQIIMKGSQALPVAVIFNGYVSGAALGEEIQTKLFDLDIRSDIIECEADLDPFMKVLELEIDNYSALIAVGGDGTFNQMINGMLARPDKKRLPVGLVPTGNSNDIARSLGISIDDITSAIESLSKCEAIGIDTTRVLIDRSSESGLATDAGRLQQCRHMLSNASLSMPARIANGANTWKGCFGSSAYGISTFFQGVSCGFVEDCYQLTIDDKPFVQGGVNTTLMQVSNGKYSNGGMIMNPFASVNDGLIDITWISDPTWMTTYSTSGIMSDARSGGGI